MKFIACVLLLAGLTAAQDFRGTIAAFEKPKDYVVKYDKFKDLTVITTLRRRVKSKNFLTATVYAAFDGQEPKGDICYYLTLGWSGDQAADEAIMIIDGQRMILQGRTSVDTRLAGGRYSAARISRTYETTFAITATQINVIGAASKVEVQIASTEGSLPPDILRILRDLYSLKGR